MLYLEERLPDVCVGRHLELQPEWLSIVYGVGCNPSHRDQLASHGLLNPVHGKGECLIEQTVKVGSLKVLHLNRVTRRSIVFRQCFLL
jgi:hypothetical protein